MTDPLSALEAAIAAAAPRADAAMWQSVLAGPMRAARITTAPRIAMFVGQCAVESAGFMAMEENLNYSAERLCEVWPTHFDAEDAALCAHYPERIADHAYANRMGNGDVLSGDGWRFRGRGLIQLTGRFMYELFAKADPRAADPDWLTTPVGAAASACWFWTLQDTRPSLNVLSDAWNIPEVTRQINGGFTGLTERTTACEAALAVLDGAGATPTESDADRLMEEELDRLNTDSDADRLMDEELARLRAQSI